uniref:(northern house mosquito) hypothetical protein n=1 Tax=Culex pipiens TaxID=7175 RepID=A0A8D8A4I2_CULPI
MLFPIVQCQKTYIRAGTSGTFVYHFCVSRLRSKTSFRCLSVGAHQADHGAKGKLVCLFRSPTISSPFFPASPAGLLLWLLRTLLWLSSEPRALRTTHQHV